MFGIFFKLYPIHIHPKFNFHYMWTMGTCRDCHKIWHVGLFCCIVFASTTGAILEAPQVSNCAANITIDEAFQSCSVPRTTFTAPEDSKQWTIRPRAGTALRFSLRSSSGAASLELTMAGNPYAQPQSEDTAQGPATVVLPATDLAKGGKNGAPTAWIMTVRNLYGITTWWLQVEAIPATTHIQDDDKGQLVSMFMQCCGFVEATSSAACSVLGDWVSANSSDTDTDACHSKYASCSPDGRLTELTLPGYSVDNGSMGPEVQESFSEVCSVRPPIALSRLKALTVLDMDGHGLAWEVADVAQLVSALPALEQLYLGSNYIQGTLDQASCSMFQGNLATLSFRNNPESSYFNTISGAVHPCVFSKNLTALNLEGNQITSLPAIPVGSPLRSLRVANQRDKDTGDRCLGGNVSQSFGNASQLLVLDLSSNDLMGEIPALPPSLQVLDLSDNRLAGKFPEGFSALANLVLLNLSDNEDLHQELPESGLSKLTKVAALLLSATSISGDLNSVDWSQLAYLTVLQISNAEVSGILPPSLATLPRLKLLDVSHNSGITSQADFAQALSSSNHINLYLVSNCGLKDLPEGLLQLAVFQSNETYLDAHVDWVGWGKVFDVSGNQISGMAVPDWLFTPFPASDHFVDGVAFMGLQGQGPSNETGPENSMTCPDSLNLTQKQFQTSRLIFKTGYSNGMEIEGSAYSIGSSAALYCLDKTGKSVFIGDTLHPGKPDAAVPASSTPSASTPSKAASAKSAASRVTSFEEDQPRLSHGAIIGITLVSILVALALVGGAVYLVRRFITHKRVNPFSEFSDELRQASKNAVQLASALKLDGPSLPQKIQV